MRLLRKRGARRRLATSVYLTLVQLGPSSADVVAGYSGPRGGIPAERPRVDDALAWLARKHWVAEVAPGVWAALVETAPGSGELRVVGRDG
jgi:hypothetical protein